MLNAIGYPSFAAHNQEIVSKTEGKCMRRLEGKYGYKRYLRDGENHQLEDKGKPFYESKEIKVCIRFIRIIILIYLKNQ